MEHRQRKGGHAVRLTVGAREKTTPRPSREGQPIRDKITPERGEVIRVYSDGWLLVERADGKPGLFQPQEVEPPHSLKGERGDS